MSHFIAAGRGGSAKGVSTSPEQLGIMLLPGPSNLLGQIENQTFPIKVFGRNQIYLFFLFFAAAIVNWKEGDSAIEVPSFLFRLGMTF